MAIDIVEKTNLAWLALRMNADRDATVDGNLLDQIHPNVYISRNVQKNRFQSKSVTI